MTIDDHEVDDDDREWPRDRRWRHPRLPPNLLVSARLDDGQWLNVGTRLPPPSSDWALPALVSMAVMAVALSVIVIVMVRRMTRPLAALAGAAERLGRGEAVPPVPERGPVDMRETTRAFNRMHARLQRFVQDRTRMLAAISHDLRTPITSLRLRAEFIEDDEIRGKILETLEDMQRMAEATLAFAREEAAKEDTRLVDLAALVDSVCADLADMGQDVAFQGPDRSPYRGRPSSLKRAFSNLIENAVTYGTLRPRVAGGRRSRMADPDRRRRPRHSRRPMWSASSPRSCAWRNPATPRPAAWASAWPSAARSSAATAATSRLPTAPKAACGSRSGCRRTKARGPRALRDRKPAIDYSPTARTLCSGGMVR